MKYNTGFCLETTFVALLSVKFLGLKLLLCNEQIWGLTVLQKCHHHKQYLFLYDFVTLKGGPWRMVSNMLFCCFSFFQSSSPNNFTHLFHSTILQNSSYSVALTFFFVLLMVLEVLLVLVWFEWFFVLNVLIELGHLSLFASMILAIPSSTLNDNK